MVAGHFSAMRVDSKNLVVYDRNKFQRDTAIGAWEKRWAVLQKQCAGISIDARLADMPITRCQQKVSYCCRLREAIDRKMKINDGDQQ